MFGDGSTIDVPGPTLDFGFNTQPTYAGPAPTYSTNISNDFRQTKTFAIVWALLSTVSAALSGYHGYKRNNSLGYGLLWFALGGLFPIVVPTIGFAQGFAKRKA